MAKSVGILTSRGGLASHAAVVARGWGIPAVVGAGGVEVRDREIVVGDQTLRAGDVLTIDGSTGEVFEGVVAGATEPMPEAQTLLDWAEGLGIAIGDDGTTDTAVATPPSPAPSARAATTDDCLRALSIKGLAQAEAV